VPVAPPTTTREQALPVPAGGERNDLDSARWIGLGTSDHTYFEMLGNYSFGDEFTREAIMCAWGFIVRPCENFRRISLKIQAETAIRYVFRSSFC